MVQHSNKKRLSTDLISSVLIIVLGVSIWVLSGNFPDLDEGYPGPNLFPRVIAIGLVLIGVLVIISEVRSGKQAKIEGLSIPFSSLTRPGLVVLVLTIFPLISPLIGFPISLFLVTICVGLIFRLKWWKTILTSGLTVGMIYLVFSQLLGVLL